MSIITNIKLLPKTNITIDLKVKNVFLPMLIVVRTITCQWDKNRFLVNQQ